MFSRFCDGALISIFTVIAVSSTCEAANIVIGQVAPVSVADSPGNQIRAGVQVYFDAVNAQGGVHGRTLSLISKDRSLKAADAVNKTRDLLKESKPLALVGMIGTGPMEAIVKSKVLEDDNVPVVGIRTGAISLHYPVNPLLFNTRVNYADEVDAITTQLATIGLNQVAIFSENSAFGKSGVTLIEEAAKRKHLTVVGNVLVEPNTIAVDGAVAALQKLQPKAIILVSDSASAAAFYKTWRTTSANHVHVIALSVVDGVEVAKKIGNDMARGLIVTRVVPEPTNTAIPLVRELHANFKKYPQRGMSVNQTLLEGYLAAKVLVEGIRKAGPNPTRERLRVALDSMKMYDAGGLIIDFSATNHSGSKFVESAIMLRSGKLMR